MSAFK